MLVGARVGFGSFMSLGAYWVLADSLSLVALVLSLIVMLLVSNLRLLNQFPDVGADRQIGRRHLPIVIGRPASARVFMDLAACICCSGGRSCVAGIALAEPVGLGDTAGIDQVDFR